MPEARLFLERRSYRKRRIMDAVRMLPFLCALLWIVVPAMWPTGVPAGTATSLSTALWYIFTVWVLAITATFALWRRTGETEPMADAGRSP
tara:strand:- start:217 stop:489 length:273 start_codon:yes stop_codon:yes gene_type:complete